MDRVLPEDVDELGISLVSHFTRSDTHTDWRAQGVCGADRDQITTTGTAVQGPSQLGGGREIVIFTEKSDFL